MRTGTATRKLHPDPRVGLEARGSAPISSIGFLLLPGFSLMSYASCVEPLRAANVLAQRTLYRWWHAAPGNRPAAATSGAVLVPDLSLESKAPGIDLLLVCAAGNPSTFNDRRILAWLRSLARRGVIIGGVSAGPFIMAKAGLLTGRRCTVHWEHMPALQEAFPELRLTRTLFELDADRITCSGGVAGLDMMIALITRDHGYELGAEVSDWFLHTAVREGAGPQRMDLRFRLGIGDEKLLAVLKAMEANLEMPLSRQHLARIAGLSLRQLERQFHKGVGRGLHAHYLALRLRRSRQLLRETSLSVLEVGVATGFASASHFSRAFRAAFGDVPRAARQRLTSAR
ncbi:MAG TPA: GlxA family transcriptional regulator [Steroidobacteraceae bacterium]|nr:GlxA family transcriptional regulator [Steroidobacteraceae bacterium]